MAWETTNRLPTVVGLPVDCGVAAANYESGSRRRPLQSEEVRLTLRCIANFERESGSDVIDLFGEMSSGAGPTALSLPSLTASLASAVSRSLVEVLSEA